MRVSFPVGGPIYCGLQEQETCQSRRLFLVTTLLLGDCRETRDKVGSVWRQTGAWRQTASETHSSERMAVFLSCLSLFLPPSH